MKDLGAKCFDFTKMDSGAIRGIKKSAFAQGQIWYNMWRNGKWA